MATRVVRALGCGRGGEEEGICVCAEAFGMIASLSIIRGFAVGIRSRAFGDTGFGLAMCFITSNLYKCVLLWLKLNEIDYQHESQSIIYL